jgi:hypothetical protein
MNLDALQQKLIAAARAHPPTDSVPYAFERRILARLAGLPGEDSRVLWGRALWRAAAACVGVSLLLGALSFFSMDGGAGSSQDQDFESTVFAAAQQLSDSW